MQSAKLSRSIRAALVTLVFVILGNLTWAAPKLKVIHNFTGGRDGVAPGMLIPDGSGNLYGVTAFGGSNGYGTVFKLTRLANGGWRNTILYHFTGGSDEGYPEALVFDGAGNLYGITQGLPSQFGTVFKLTPVAGGGWKEKVLYTFKGRDGAYPSGGLVFDPAGNLYGTTYSGGKGPGTVFRLSPRSGGKWAETVIYAFQGKLDGSDPVAPLTWDAAGNLYGTTLYGGSSRGAGKGTVFELSPSSGGGWTESILNRFTGGRDGDQPFAGVIFDAAGNLYGTTWVGGVKCAPLSQRCGLVFELSPESGNTWKESVIYDFLKVKNAIPEAGLVFDSTGNLYGTTAGASCCGAVFELAPAPGGGWKETTLHTFTGGKDGGVPRANLVLDSAGNLYGTASSGGSVNDGVAFEITP
jgi:uncharacterized repeat protein (TIGR03803 family)